MGRAFAALRGTGRTDLLEWAVLDEHDLTPPELFVCGDVRSVRALYADALDGTSHSWAMRNRLDRLAVLLQEGHQAAHPGASVVIKNWFPPLAGAAARANGVETYRQQVPSNAEDIATLLLEAGADRDAEMCVYGGGHTALALASSSSHTRRAGVLDGLVRTLSAEKSG